MRVLINGLELTGGASNKREEADGLQVSATQAFQTEAYLGANEVVSFDRGNKRTRIVFAVTKAHADDDTAEAYILSHGKVCHDNAGGQIQFLDTASVSRGTLDQGRIVSADLDWHRGKTTRWRYVLEAGAIN